MISLKDLSEYLFNCYCYKTRAERRSEGERSSFRDDIHSLTHKKKKK